MFCVRKIELNASAPNLPITLIPKETLADLAQAGHLLENAEAQAQALILQAEVQCKKMLEQASVEFWQRANAQLLRWDLERQAMSDNVEHIAASITQAAVRTLLDEATPAQRITVLLKHLLTSQVPAVKGCLLCNPQDRTAVEHWLHQHSYVPWALRCKDEVTALALILETDEGDFHIDWQSTLGTLLPTPPS
ncbi:type III secretion system stator protein SctL [Pseudomonas sp. SB113]|uniref:type III secretion system stator protein SctL n=1 Tax=Pseudomonas sp. SB113 TaxID=3154123 RepID=UPI00345DF42E